MSALTRILVEDPELGEHLDPPRRAAAERHCVARTFSLPRGRWSPPSEVGGMRMGIGLLVLEGLLVRRVGLAGRFGAELLGPGDLLRPWQREDVGTSVPRMGKWRVLTPCRLAVLDGEFAVRVGRYPEVVSSLFARAVRRARHMAVSIAIVHQPRVDLRLEMLFWELADRWGTVHRDGVHVPVALTHAMLADLVGARRPSVTKALGDLAARSAVTWTGEHWLLSGGPPSELSAVGAVAIRGAG